MRHRHRPDAAADRRRARESVRHLRLVKDSGPDPVRHHEALEAENHPYRVEYPRNMKMPNGSVVCLSPSAPDELAYSMSIAVYAEWGVGSCGHAICADDDGHIDECRYREMEDA